MFRFKQAVAAICVAFVAAAAIVPVAQAQEAFPSKPLRIVVPFPPGGASDAIARLLAAGMKEKLGQPVLIDNKGGGGTVIGTDIVAKSPPDGYTILWMTAPFAVNESLQPHLPYSALKDFTPLIDLASNPLVVIVNPASPARTLRDFIDMAKKSPGKLTFGSSGNGGSPHLAMEMFKAKAGIYVNHIPYRGSAPAVADLIGGQTDVVIDTLFLTVPQINAGKARALAQTGIKRSALLPDVPTMREAGIQGYEATSWFSFAVPAGTPPDVVRKLNAVTNEVLQMSSVRETLDKQGLDLHGGTPEDSLKHLKVEIDRWRGVIRAAGIKAD